MPHPPASSPPDTPAVSPAPGARVLITGFEPFDREPVNPSWEAARALDGWQFQPAAADGAPPPDTGAATAVTVTARCMPCVFGESLQVLAAAIAECRPSLVIGVGQAGGRTELSIERVAINLDDGRIHDNAGRQPIDRPVVEGGPAAYFSSLPIKAMVRALHRAGLPASVSNTAGTFVCNHLFYGLMHQLANLAPAGQGAADVRGGFIHIPYLPEQAARHPGQPSLALPTLIDALRIAVRTAWTVRQDVVETGGRLH